MKRGISLIAVLMFMLAATTASVVIFKWIGSENFSSGARLKASEAYQASESGIDYVRSWMENKAADVGGLVTQYYSNDPLIPVKIFENDIEIGDKGQKFSAYLIGIDSKANPVLKLKVLVEGNARDSSKVFQTAILSTDGLYQVFMPDEVERKKTTIQLSDYFGGDLDFSGEKKFSSATINGNWTGNPLNVEKDFVVTGDLLNSGSGVNIGKNACVGGNYSPNNNNVIIGGSLYIGSSIITTNPSKPGEQTSGFVGNANSYQKNVYCNGDMEFGTTGSDTLGINGNLTLNGKMSRFNGARVYRVKGSLVLGDSAKYYTTAYIDGSVVRDAWGNDIGGLSKTGNRKFVVCDDVWTRNAAGVKVDETDQGKYINFNYGRTSEEGCPSKSSAALFFKDAVPYAAVPEYRTESSEGYFRSEAANKEPTTSNQPVGASEIKEYCMEIFCGDKKGCTQISGCNGSKYKVSDPIATSLDSIERFLNEKAPSSEKSGSFICLNNTATNIDCRGDIDSCGSNIKFTNLLNDCYQQLKDQPKKLYGGTGGYLVVKLNQKNDVSLVENNYLNSIALDGKFIFIYEGNQSSLYIAPTTDASKVIVFLKQGVNGEMKSDKCINKQTGRQLNQGESEEADAGNYYKYPYFIYSLKDINMLNNWDKNCPLKGNIFFPSQDCAKVKNVNNEFSLASNADLVDDLMEMGVLCRRIDGRDGQNCTAKELKETKNPEKDTDDETNQNPGEGDSHWIPIATRLPIKLETKEIRKETPQTSENLRPSILVMPRVIRLAPGQAANNEDLPKYYEYLYLNGATEADKPNPSNINCPSINYNEKGRYQCTISNGAKASVSEFHVIIGKIGETP